MREQSGHGSTVAAFLRGMAGLEGPAWTSVVSMWFTPCVIVEPEKEKAGGTEKTARGWYRCHSVATYLQVLMSLPGAGMEKKTQGKDVWHGSGREACEVCRQCGYQKTAFGVAKPKDIAKTSMDSPGFSWVDRGRPCFGWRVAQGGSHKGLEGGETPPHEEEVYIGIDEGSVCSREHLASLVQLMALHLQMGHEPVLPT